MTARADDRILWLPTGHMWTLYDGLLYHVCERFAEHAGGIRSPRRDELDPLAVGTCRYCRQPLPVRAPTEGQA